MYIFKASNFSKVLTNFYFFHFVTGILTNFDASIVKGKLVMRPQRCLIKVCFIVCFYLIKQILKNIGIKIYKTKTKQNKNACCYFNNSQVNPFKIVWWLNRQRRGPRKPSKLLVKKFIDFVRFLLFYYN